MTDARPRYEELIEEVFLARYEPGAEIVEFTRDDLRSAAEARGMLLPKNLGDVVYAYRFRNDFPAAITERAPEGKDWIIRLAGRGKYRFVAVELTVIEPRAGLALTKIPDATPGMVAGYSLDDEQALLARLRYNRMIDLFTGLTCYSLQNHLRTTTPTTGQIETDELYVGVDVRGIHYVVPVQAKGGSDRLNVVQVEQDILMCRHKFPQLVCRPIAAQFLSDGGIALFELDDQQQRVVIQQECHYLLVPPDALSDAEIANYRKRLNS